MMQALVLESYGNNDHVHLRDTPVPVPGPHDLLVRVHAASINPVDFKIRDGKVKTLLKYRLPLIMGNDLSGVVHAVGAEVTKFKPGDAVFARLDKLRIGALAEFAVVSDTAAAIKPATLSHVQAASLPLVALTAWQALVDIGRVQPGQSILVHAGSGGVGTFAIQLGKHLGARVATTAGSRNAQLVRELGADVIIDYRSQRFDEALRDLDFVLDTQGGETLLRSFDALRPGGTVVSIGGIPDAKFARAWGLNPLLTLVLGWMSRKVSKAAREKNAHYEYLFMRADGAQLAQIGALVDAGVIKPVIDRTFPLAQAKEALAYVESGRAVGKVVVEVLAG